MNDSCIIYRLYPVNQCIASEYPMVFHGVRERIVIVKRVRAFIPHQSAGLLSYQESLQQFFLVIGRFEQYIGLRIV